MPNHTGLLVSVRSVAEAAAALAGGADLIDVKEPSRGPLGRADDETIAEVVRFVAGRRSVSAALGELLDGGQPPRQCGLDFIKRGLAGCSPRIDWRSQFSELQRDRRPQSVIVAYADWKQAEAPHFEEVAVFASRRSNGVFLLDTFTKTPGLAPCGRASLLTWISVKTVTRLCASLRSAGVRVALAGSLDTNTIAELRAAEPDWFAVRGAACEQGRRDGSICAARVRSLKALLDPIPQVSAS